MSDFKLANLIKRNSQLLLNMAGMFGAKCLAMVVQLLTVPAYLSYFQEQTVLGVWYSLLSILNLVLTFDLGLGNGLRNKLAISLEKKDRVASKTLVSSAYAMVGLVSLLMMMASGLLFPLINWNIALNVSEAVVKSSTLLLCAQIVFSGIAVYFTLKLVTSILYALQKPALINILMISTSAVVLIFVMFDKATTPEEKLLRVSVCNFFALNIPPAIATIVVFLTSLRDVRPNINNIDKTSSVSLIMLGAAFFILQLVSAVIGNTNEILIALLLQPKDVVDYQSYYRLFNVFVSVFGLIVTPIWSAVTQKQAQGNYIWIRTCHFLMMASAVVAAIVMAALAPFLQPITNIWLGEHTILLQPEAVASFIVCTSLMIMNSANTCIANGLGWLKAQLICLSIGALLNIPLAFLFVKLTGSWIAIEIANAISLLPICIAQPIYIEKKIASCLHEGHARGQ